MATVINILCIDQKLKFQSLPSIASGGVNEDKVSFIFCEKWADLTKTAVFYRTQDEIYHQLLDESSSCFIPWEVLRDPGFLYIGVFGVNEEKTRTSEIIRCVIKQGAITEDTAISDPTPDIYAQILANMNGGYYIPVIEQITADTLQISFPPSNDTLPTLEPTVISLPSGNALPTVSETDDGKVLAVVSGEWAVSELPDHSTDIENTLIEKLSGIEEGAQVNVIEAITVNGEAVEVVDKTVNITINVSNLTQSENEELILYGGNADIYI